MAYSRYSRQPSRTARRGASRRSNSRGRTRLRSGTRRGARRASGSRRTYGAARETRLVIQIDPTPGSTSPLRAQLGEAMKSATTVRNKSVF